MEPSWVNVCRMTVAAIALALPFAVLTPARIGRRAHRVLIVVTILVLGVCGVLIGVTAPDPARLGRQNR